MGLKPQIIERYNLASEEGTTILKKINSIYSVKPVSSSWINHYIERFFKPYA